MLLKYYMKRKMAVIFLGTLSFYLFLSQLTREQNGGQSHPVKGNLKGERLHLGNNSKQIKNGVAQHDTQRASTDSNHDVAFNSMQSQRVAFQNLAKKYSINNTLIVSVTDMGYIEMALNLYESSFRRFHIDNYIFVCSHEKAEQFLSSRGIHAISLWNDSLSATETLFHERGYRNKTNFKRIQL